MKVHNNMQATDLIKKYFKSGVMVEGMPEKSKEGSPQGVPMSQVPPIAI